MIAGGLFDLLNTAFRLQPICEGRIFPIVLPNDSKFPAITYKILVAPQKHTLDTTGMQHWKVQFECWGQTYPDADRLRAALIETLNGEGQIMSDGTFLQDSYLEDLSDDYAQMFRAHRCMADIVLNFNFKS